MITLVNSLSHEKVNVNRKQLRRLKQLLKQELDRLNLLPPQFDRTRMVVLATAFEAFLWEIILNKKEEWQ